MKRIVYINREICRKVWHRRDGYIPCIVYRWEFAEFAEWSIVKRDVFPEFKRQPGVRLARSRTTARRPWATAALDRCVRSVTRSGIRYRRHAASCLFTSVQWPLTPACDRSVSVRGTTVVPHSISEAVEYNFFNALHERQYNADGFFRFYC